MRLIWTRMELFGKDDVITWGFDHEVSHFAIEFFNGSAILHSDSMGVEVIEPEGFYKRRKKIYEIPMNLSPEQEIEVFEAMVKKWGRKKYDYKYFMSLAVQGVKIKFFNCDLNVSEIKQSENDIICHELFQLIPDAYRPKIDVSQAVMPELLYLEIKKWTDKEG